MLRILLATYSAMPCRPHRVGSASALFALEGGCVLNAGLGTDSAKFLGVAEESHEFSGSSIRERITVAVANWLKQDKLLKSGRCRATLIPT